MCKERKIPQVEIIFGVGRTQITDVNGNVDFTLESGKPLPKQFYVDLDNNSYLASYYYRMAVTLTTSWLAVTEEIVDALTKFIGSRTVADVGCGKGYLSSCLKVRGCDVKSFDNFSDGAWDVDVLKSDIDEPSIRFNCDSSCPHIFTDIIRADMDEYDFSSFDIVLLSWPRDPDVFLKKMRKGQTLIFIGEPGYGCTGTEETPWLLEELFEEITMNFCGDGFFSWGGIHDQIDIYRKK